MSQDMCVVCGDGILNIRAGAIILKDGKLVSLYLSTLLTWPDKQKQLSNIQRFYLCK